MRADWTTVQFGPHRLPIVGKPVPRGDDVRKTPRSAWVRDPRGAGLLTPAPKNRQHGRRSASRGGTRYATTAAGPPAAAPDAGARRRVGASRSSRDGRRRCAATANARGERNPQGRDSRFGPVDTQRPSDTLANLKTYGISIGSASFYPPASCSEALPRRSWRMDSDDGRRSGRGVLSWSAKWRQRAANSERRSRGPSTYFVGKARRSGSAITLSNAHSRASRAFESFPPTPTPVVGPPRSTVSHGAACALQELPASKVHGWLWGWRTRRWDDERVRFELR